MLLYIAFGIAGFLLLACMVMVYFLNKYVTFMNEADFIHKMLYIRKKRLEALRYSLSFHKVERYTNVQALRDRETKINDQIKRIDNILTSRFIESSFAPSYYYRKQFENDIVWFDYELQEMEAIENGSQRGQENQV